VSSSPGAIIVTDGTADEQLLREAVGGGSPPVIPLTLGVNEALRVIEVRPPALLVLACATSSGGALELVREVRTRYQDCAIVVLHAGSPNGFMERAFQFGADDLITLPQSPDSLSFVFEKAVARRRGASPTSVAPLVCIVGPKGGTGKTLTACNLGVALARTGARPVIVDIDLQFGDVGLALGLRPHHTIYDLALSGSRIDGETIGRFVTRHESGLSVLLAPARPDQAGAVSIDFLRSLYARLVDTYDFVIVDTPPAFTPEVIATIDAASDLCVVGMLDALSLKDTKIGLETLGLMGCNLDDTVLVLNRADTNVGISLGDVERLLNRAPDVLVPSDRAIPRAITDGVPIVVADSRSGAARAFTELAAIYAERAGVAVPLNPDRDRRSSSRRSLLRKGR
jgi:pilus assembly protein CpaE